MSDPIAPSTARRPAEVVELVALAVSGGDLDAARAQYEPGAVLQPWAQPTGVGRGAIRHWLRALMDLRLPVSAGGCTELLAGDVALVLSLREISGTGPDCQRVDLRGLGATVVRRQPCGGWRIVADAWQLTGSGAAGLPANPPGPPRSPSGPLTS